MTSHELQRKIVVALKYGKLDHFQIAADICQAPFRVRAELKALKRECLVREEFGAENVLWELTSVGYAAAWEVDQMALTNGKERGA